MNLIAIVLLILLGCNAFGLSTQPNEITSHSEIIRYAAIGDSYSIGEGASERESWPAHLARHTQSKRLPITSFHSPTTTGIGRETPHCIEEKFVRESFSSFARLAELGKVR